MPHRTRTLAADARLVLFAAIVAVLLPADAAGLDCRTASEELVLIPTSGDPRWDELTVTLSTGAGEVDRARLSVRHTRWTARWGTATFATDPR